MITNHGENRLRKRTGVSKKSVEKNFEKALENGRQHNEFKGQFKKYLDFYAREYSARPIIYNNSIYWVRGSNLITVYTIPGKFRIYL